MTRASPSVPAGLVPPPIKPPVAHPTLLALPAAKPSAREPTAARLALASVLIAWGNEALLTNPWFSEKSGSPGYYTGEGLPMGLDEPSRRTSVLAGVDHDGHFDVDARSLARSPRPPVRGTQ